MMSLFEQMSWGQAVDYVRSIGLLTNLLVLSVPLFAVITIIRGKRTRPGETMVFAHVVLWTCAALLVAAIAYFFTGRWYGENGPPPQVTAYYATLHFGVTVLVVAAIHWGLHRSSRPRPPGLPGAAVDVDSGAGHSTRG